MLPRRLTRTRTYSVVGNTEQIYALYARQFVASLMRSAANNPMNLFTCRRSAYLLREADAAGPGITGHRGKSKLKRADGISQATRRKISVFVALLLAIAVATILITPDPTDDIHGILCSHHALKSPALSASVGVSLVLLSLASLAAASPPIPTTSNLLRLICMCRC